MGEKEVTIMEEFEIDEISAVDRPAQPHAKMVLMKRDEMKGGDTPMGGDVDDEDEDLEMMDEQKMSPVQKENTDMDNQMKEQFAKLEALASMNDRQKAFHKSLVGADADAFLAKSFEEREARIDEVEKGDPVVYTTDSGIEIRKSADPVLLALAKESDGNRRDAREAKKALANQAFAKRADAELGNLPGSVDMKVEVLKALETGLPESCREEAREMFKSANTSMAGVFSTNGTSEAQPALAKAEDKLDRMAKEYAEKHDVSFAKAMAEVVVTPEGAALYERTTNA